MAIAFGGANAFATNITINDPSFEAPALACGVGCFGSNGDFAGKWTLLSGIGVVFMPSAGAPGDQFISAIPDGNQVAALGASNVGGELVQDLAATVQANTTYTLTFFVGNRSDVNFISETVSLETNLGAVLQSDTLCIDCLGYPGTGLFTQRTIVFNSGAAPAQLGKTIRIDVAVPNSVSGNHQADFDNFSLTAVPTVTAGAPEPGSLMLGCSGLLFLAGTLLRKRRILC
jgi:hypothetical protein